MAETLTPPDNLAAVDTFTTKLTELARTGGKLTLEPGVYSANIDLPQGTKGFVLEGAGRDRTFIRSTVKNTPAFRTSGMWYSRIANVAFETTEANTESAVVDIDGGLGGRGHGVQGNTFDNVTFDGRGAATGEMSDIAFAMCRTAKSGGQGSENTFLNCHFIGAKQALCYIVGYNALNNQFIGGNCQQYERNALEMLFGSFHVFGMGFQSTVGIRQIDNDGWDIRAEGGGVGDGLSINGCRTESLRFLKGNPSQPPMVTNCNQRVAISPWWEGVQYRVGDAVLGMDNRLYRCRVDHLSRESHELLGDSWEHVVFSVVESLSAWMANNNWQCGDVSVYHDLQCPVWQVYASDIGRTLTVDIPIGQRVVTIDASRGPVRLVLPDPSRVPIGTEIEFVRLDTPEMKQSLQGDKSKEYPVTIVANYIGNENLFSLSLSRTVARAPMSTRVVRLRALGGGSVARRWYAV